MSRSFAISSVARTWVEERARSTGPPLALPPPSFVDDIEPSSSFSGCACWRRIIIMLSARRAPPTRPEPSLFCPPLPRRSSLRTRLPPLPPVSSGVDAELRTPLRFPSSLLLVAWALRSIWLLRASMYCQHQTPTSPPTPGAERRAHRSRGTRACGVFEPHGRIECRFAWNREMREMRREMGGMSSGGGPTSGPTGGGAKHGPQTGQTRATHGIQPTRREAGGPIYAASTAHTHTTERGAPFVVCARQVESRPTRHTHVRRVVTRVSSRACRHAHVVTRMSSHAPWAASCSRGSSTCCAPSGCGCGGTARPSAAAGCASSSIR